MRQCQGAAIARCGSGLAAMRAIWRFPGKRLENFDARDPDVLRRLANADVFVFGGHASFTDRAQDVHAFGDVAKDDPAAVLHRVVVDVNRDAISA